MTYLLDTNFCIEIIRGRNQVAVGRITVHDAGEIAIGAITVAELEYGVATSGHTARNKIALLQFLAPFEILPFDSRAASRYGAVRQALESKGLVIGPMDLLIAAQALAADLVLVTNNAREFNGVPDLEVENWTA